MVATAVLLVDFQNEFAKPEGKLHAAVDEVMTQTGMMENVPEFVEFARYVGRSRHYTAIGKTQHEKPSHLISSSFYCFMMHTHS